MSKKLQNVMRYISWAMGQVYKADEVVVVPSGGTAGMEAVAYPFAIDKNVMII